MGRVGANIKSQVSGMGDTPHMEDLLGAVKVMLDSYVLMVKLTNFIFVIQSLSIR